MTMRITQSRCREMHVAIMEDVLNIDRSESHGYFYYHFCFAVIENSFESETNRRSDKSYNYEMHRKVLTLISEGLTTNRLII